MKTSFVLQLVVNQVFIQILIKLSIKSEQIQMYIKTINNYIINHSAANRQPLATVASQTLNKHPANNHTHITSPHQQSLQLQSNHKGNTRHNHRSNQQQRLSFHSIELKRQKSQSKGKRKYINVMSNPANKNEAEVRGQKKTFAQNAIGQVGDGASDANLTDENDVSIMPILCQKGINQSLSSKKKLKVFTQRNHNNKTNKCNNNNDCLDDTIKSNVQSIIDKVLILSTSVNNIEPCKPKKRHRDITIQLITRDKTLLQNGENYHQIHTPIKKFTEHSARNNQSGLSSQYRSSLINRPSSSKKCIILNGKRPSIQNTDISIAKLPHHTINLNVQNNHHPKQSPSPSQIAISHQQNSNKLQVHLSDKNIINRPIIHSQRFQTNHVFNDVQRKSVQNSLSKNLEYLSKITYSIMKLYSKQSVNCEQTSANLHKKTSFPSKELNLSQMIVKSQKGLNEMALDRHDAVLLDKVKMKHTNKQQLSAMASSFHINLRKQIVSKISI